MHVKQGQTNLANMFSELVAFKEKQYWVDYYSHILFSG